MFDVGFQELTLIGVIALIVVGPERLPRMARTLGLWMGKIRYYVGQVKSDIDREVRAQELKEMLDKPARELDDLYKVAEETKAPWIRPRGRSGRRRPRSTKSAGRRLDAQRARRRGRSFRPSCRIVGPASGCRARAESPETPSTPPTDRRPR